MKTIAAMLDLLGQRIASLGDTAGLLQVSVPIAPDSIKDPLTLLTGQPHYPQFYWQHRNNSEQSACLGKVISFDDFAAAQAFCARYPEEKGLRIYGLNAFDSRDAALFLPRLEWRQNQSGSHLRVNLFSHHSLRQDAQAAWDFLCDLKPWTPPAPLSKQSAQESHSPTRQQWHHLIARALDHIHQGAFEKVVLARATDLVFAQPIAAAALMGASRHVNLHCYHFLYQQDPHEAFMGSSPERLWQRRGYQLRTEALAGTVVNDEDDAKAKAASDWLLQDDKNQRENALVVEDICQRLQGAVQALDVFPQQVVRLRKIQHLKRRIHAQLIRKDDNLCLHLLQPTAAVAGLPRQPAKAFITANEPFNRQWYAGSAGYLSIDESEFCVALRCAQVTDTTVRLYAGAGIVAGSSPELEWQEIDNKAAGLRSLLTDF